MRRLVYPCFSVSAARGRRERPSGRRLRGIGWASRPNALPTWAKLGFSALPRRPLDHVEAELAVAHRSHNKPAPFIGRVRLIVAPSAERHQLAQIEVRPALRALDHMVDVQAAAAAAGLAAPAGSRQDDVPDGLPLFWRGRRPAARSRLVRLPPTPRRSAERLTPDHQAR